MNVGRVEIIAFLLFAALSRALPAQCPDGSPPPCRAQPSRATSAPAPNSVAVLYFENLSPDTADQYLADGLTEQIIERLGQIERLDVLSRTAVRRYRGTVPEPRTVARTLAVVQLVSGTVRRAGSRLRVTVELVRASDGRRLWGSVYERADSDLFAIEEAIARSVAAAVVGRLLPHERDTLAVRPTRDARAYDHFLRGNHALAERNPGAVARAITEYEAAVRLDSGFTHALSRLAFAYGMFYEQRWPYGGLSQDEVLARAIGLTDRALLFDSSSSEAWLARAEMLSYAYPLALDSAIRVYRRAIALDPRNAQALHSYGLMLQWRGDDSGAVEAYHRALAADPARPVTLLNLARVSYAGRRFAESLRWIDSTLIVDPGFYAAYDLRARVLLALHRVPDARRDGEAAARLGAGIPAMLYGTLALLDVHGGDTTAARRQLDLLWSAMQDRQRPTPTEGLGAAMASIALGDTAAAVDVLERVCPHDGLFWFFLRMPEFDAIRAHPRFQRVVASTRPR